MLYFYSNSIIGRMLNQFVHVGPLCDTVTQFYGLQGLLFVCDAIQSLVYCPGP